MATADGKHVGYRLQRHLEMLADFRRGIRFLLDADLLETGRSEGCFGRRHSTVDLEANVRLFYDIANQNRARQEVGVLSSSSGF